MADAKTCPPLPSGSVDFDALHAAAKRGADLEKHLADEQASDGPNDEESEADAAPIAPISATKPTAKSGS
jgi:hypothetical protein